MKTTVLACVIVAASALAGRMAAAADAADANHGAQVFGACASCHSLTPGRNLTGPSLAGIWGRKAGSLETFHRYSSALTSSGVVWDATTLDAWLKDPAQFIPGTGMRFAGIKKDSDRSDLIAFLQEVSEGRRNAGSVPGEPSLPDLKQLPPSAKVVALTYCGDTYRVKLADGRSGAFWEFNLRFKTDSSDQGPKPGVPALLGANMQGDRAFVIFSSPEEISSFIKHQCL